jgi:hypothetical protein
LELVVLKQLQLKTGQTETTAFCHQLLLLLAVAVVVEHQSCWQPTAVQVVAVAVKHHT